MENKEIYCLCIWNPSRGELTTKFGTEQQMRLLYMNFILDFNRKEVMDYYRSVGWNDSYAEILIGDSFQFLGYDGEYHARVVKVEG